MAWYWWTLIAFGGAVTYTFAVVGLGTIIQTMGDNQPSAIGSRLSAGIPPVVLDRLDIEPAMTIGEQLAIQRKYVVTEAFLFDILGVAARIVASSQVPDEVAGDPQIGPFMAQERVRTIRILLTVAGGAKLLLDYDGSPEVQRRYMERMKALAGA